MRSGRLEDVLGMFINSRLVRGIAATAAAVTFTLGSMAPSYAGNHAGKKAKNKESIEQIMITDGSEIPNVPLVPDNEKKEGVDKGTGKKKSDVKPSTKKKAPDDDLELVPLLPQTNIDLEMPPTGSILTIQPLAMGASPGEFNKNYKTYWLDIDINKDGTNDHTFRLHLGKKGRIETYLSDITKSVLTEADKIYPDVIYSDSDFGEIVVGFLKKNTTRNLYIVCSRDLSNPSVIEGCSAYESIRVPDSVKEIDAIGKDLVIPGTSALVCQMGEAPAGCKRIVSPNVKEFYKLRVEETKWFFRQYLPDQLKKKLSKLRNGEYSEEITMADCTNFVWLASDKWKERYALVDKIRNFDDEKNYNPVINHEYARLQAWVQKNYAFLRYGEGKEVKINNVPVAKVKPESAEKTSEKPPYKPADKPKTLVKKPVKQKKLDNIVATATLPPKVDDGKKPYLPNSTKPHVVRATNVTGEEHWYEKWWVWTIAGAVVAGVAATTAGVLLTQGGSKTSTGPDDFIMNYGDYNKVGGR